MTTKRSKPPSTQFAWRALQPVIDYCRENRGAKAELVRLYEARTSSCAARPVLDAWLAQDESRRTEPKLGAGLLLLEVFEELKQTKERKKR
jgi:hypothetical protein